MGAFNGPLFLLLEHGRLHFYYALWPALYVAGPDLE